MAYSYIAQRRSTAFQLPQADEQHLRVKKVTQEHEVCEVNGFVFKRRRTIVPENTHPNQTLKTPANQAIRSASINQQLPSPPHIDTIEISAELNKRLIATLRSLPESAPHAQRLSAYVNDVCEAEIAVHAKKLGRDEKLNSALTDIFTIFTVNLNQAVEEGLISCTEAPLIATPDVPKDDGCDVEARKAGLRARLEKFEKEEAEWQTLLERVGALGDELEAEAQLIAKEVEAAENAPIDPPESKDLQHIRTEVHRELSMQVEGLCLLVGDVEELIQTADKSAQAMQAQYHEEKFATFPHVNSPLALIKAISRPQVVAHIDKTD